MRIIPKNDANAPDLGAEVLRRRGLRLTGPRRLILEVVRQTEIHPTAEWVHREVRRRLKRVSLGTVYRNLRLLVAEGVLNEIPGVPGGARPARFDGNTAVHHHFTCGECGSIHDLAEPVDPALNRRMTARTGHQVLHHRIEFFGRCADCRDRGRGRARRARRR
jgi:Fur family peroxide stress response transcriptional regulator